MAYKELELNQQISDLYLKALQSQMNPHFIFNALNGIQKFITSGEKEQAMKYLSSFAQLIRMIFEQSKQEQITLKEEVEFLNLYLKLEQFRFQDKITVDFQLDETLNLEDDTTMPPLLIQPIIENAFKHGLMHIEKDGKLLVSLQRQGDDFIKCIIEDNGIGRKKAKQLARWKIKGHKSSGLQTTEERISIINKTAEQQGFKIIDLENEVGEGIGTRVEILIKVKVRTWDLEEA